MFNLVKDEYEENIDDILKNINKMIEENRKEEENIKKEPKEENK